MTTSIHVRTTEKTKRAAQKVLENLGLDLSTAINLYLVQIVETKGIPFRIVTENGMSPAKEARILKEIEEALKYGKDYSSAKELHNDIMRGK